LSLLPFAAWQLPPPSLPVITLYYLSTLLIFISIKKRLFQIIGMIALLILMIVSLFSHFPHLRGNSTIVTFIDTGQGSSTLLELPGNKNILVDGGGSFSPRFDPGEQIITPFLWHKGIRHLDAVIISHAHHDHYNGLESVIGNFKPDEVWINGSPESSLIYRNILKSATGAGAKLIIPEKGAEIIASGPATISSLSDLHLRDNPELEENNRSLVIGLEVGGKRFILPGDIMAADGIELVRQGIELASDVLLAPHHGSRHSAGYELIRHGRPDWLVVSASPFNSGKFPDPSLVKWCEKEKMELINLADCGSVSFTIDEYGQLSWQPISAKAGKETPLPTDEKPGERRSDLGEVRRRLPQEGNELALVDTVGISIFR
jgi:competence protein ComEC